MRTANKQSRFRALLKERILSGYYEYGQQLPTGLQLAEELQSSYVTVSKVLKTLAEEGLIKSKHGVGYFVTYTSMPRDPSVKKINLITISSDNELSGTFIHEGQRIFSEAGWQVRILVTTKGLQEAQPAIIDPDYYSVLLGFRPHLALFSQILEHVRNRVVVVGDRSDREGVACVTSDERQSIRLCMEHFEKFGLMRAILVCANPENKIESHRITGWWGIHRQRGCSMKWCDQHVVSLDIPPEGGDPAPYVERLVERLIAENLLADTRGLIAPDDTTAVLLTQNLQDRGIQVPEEADVVSIRNSRLLECYRPGISSVDSHFNMQIQMALEILEHRRSESPEGPLFHCCEPSFIERRAAITTVSPVRWKTQAATPVG